MMFFVV